MEILENKNVSLVNNERIYPYDRNIENGYFLTTRVLKNTRHQGLAVELFPMQVQCVYTPIPIPVTAVNTPLSRVIV